MKQLVLMLMFLSFAIVSFAQTEIEGKVVTTTGEPLVGVNIYEKGTTNGTITNMEGVFHLKVVPWTTIVASYIGYNSVEVMATPGKTILITLEEDSREIEGVVVIGYGTQRRGDVTSAVSSVKSEDFAEGNIKDAGELVKGKIAGLTVTNGSGDPNQKSQLRLRGIISLQSSNSPLVLVDGIEGSLSSVSPENIESIDVLKDASAAAIYGTRGAGGVILITTKSGKRDQKTSVVYNGYVSASNFINKLDMMDGSDIREGLTNFNDKGYDTDWLDAISRTGYTQNHNFSIDGGNQSTTYNADFTYRKQNGVILNTYAEDMRLNAGVSHWFLDDMLKVQFNIVKSIHENGPVDAAGTQVYRQAIIRNPTEPIVNEDGSWYESNTPNYYYNPVAILKETKGEYKSDNTRLTGNITFEPIKGWQTNLMVGTIRANGHTKTYLTSKYFSQRTQYLTGYAYQYYGYSKSDNVEITSNYKHTFEKHRIDVLGGYSYQYNMDESFSANNTNFMSDYYEADNLGAGQYLKDGKAGMGSYKGDDKLIGFFGRVSYGFDDKYNVLASIRHEGSSKFGNNHKWGTFYSASLGWNVTNETFMEIVHWLNHLKVRAGVGQTGVVPSDRYLSYTTWSLGSSYFYQNGKWIQGLAVDQNANPEIKWEKSTEYNFGIDFCILQDKINGSIDLYNKQTKDLLYTYTVPVPPNLYGYTLANVGKLENKGIEISVTASVFKNEDYEWKTTVTASHNTNKLKSLSNDLYETTNYIDEGYLGEPISLPTQRIEVGKSIGQFYGMKSVGVSENGLWLIENKETGEIEEFNDNMLTDDKYHQYLGNALPKVYVGWVNNFTYKNWDLSTVFTGQFGFYILNEARAYYENNAVNYNRMKSAADLHDGYALSPAQKQTFVSYYLEKGDFFKLSSITLGYTIPLAKNKYVKSIRLSASADNLFTITGYSGLDPELSNGSITSAGIDWRDKYPTVRTFTFGVNVNF